MVQFGKDEKRDWEQTLETNTIPAIRRFLAIYPMSVHAPEGMRILANLKEEKMWELTTRQDVMFAYENYLKEYPSGKYAALAGEKIEKLEDQLAWKETCKKNTVSAYLEYKSNFPSGEFVSEVEQKITALVRAKSGNSGGETEDDDTLNEEAALEAATNEDSVSAYNQFLKRFPDGEYADQVRNRIHQLEIHLTRQYRAIEEELQAWEYADKQDSLLSYRDFIKNFPEGRFAPLARQRIKNLERKLQGKVVIKSGEHIVSGQKSNSGNTASKSTKPFVPGEKDKLERDLQGFRLAVIWGMGFGILSIATRLLSPGFFPLSLIAAILVGGFFVYQRNKHLTSKEVSIYLAGTGLIIFWITIEIFLTMLNNYAVAIIFSGIFAILFVIILRHYYRRYQNREG
ncbi:MAG: hypothetical protein R3D00_16255 [Bacteroidia bacterium]